MVEVRKVGYSNTKGVFLGFVYAIPAWSKDQNVSKALVAPTFLTEVDLLQYVAAHGPDTACKFTRPDDFEMREVRPSAGNVASSEDCGRAMLGTWHE